MKHIILLVSLAFSLNAFAQIPTDSLKAYYPFNGNAIDMSGNGNNGTINGATLTNDRFGNINSAFNFDGIDDFIQINTVNNSLFENDFSVSLWCSVDSFINNYLHLICGENNFITLNGNGPSYLSEFSKVSAYQGPILPLNSRRIQYFSTNTQLMEDNYYHIVFLKLDTTAFLYLNGKLESSIYVDNSIPIPIGSYLQIGSGYNNSTDYCFDGKIDDIRIYNRGLDSIEIAALYIEGLCYQTITVTDTLIINATLTGFNPVTYQNSIKIYPNPTNDHITIDFGGNYSTMNGYSLNITNSLSQIVYTTSINTQTTTVDLSTWTGNGIYFVHLIDASNNTIDIRKIVLQ